MKVLLTSDWHLDATTAGVRRLDEFRDYLREVVDTANAERVDAILVLGDYFNPGGMDAHGLTCHLMSAAHVLAGAAPVVMLAGNHDVVETSEGWTTLSPLWLASNAGYPWNVEQVHVAQLPATILVNGIAVLCLPYTAASIADDAAAGLRDAIKDAATMVAEGAPLVVIGHLSVPGAILSSESREMARGRDLDFPFEMVAGLRPVLVANGHYHRAQTVTGPNGLEVLIPGSPWRVTFGESEDTDKGFTIVEWGT